MEGAPAPCAVVPPRVEHVTHPAQAFLYELPSFWGHVVGSYAGTSWYCPPSTATIRTRSTLPARLEYYGLYATFGSTEDLPLSTLPTRTGGTLLPS